MIYNINKSEIAMNIWIKAEKAFHKTRHQIFIKSFSKWRVEGYILNLKVGVCEQAMVQMMLFPKRKNQCFSAKLGNKLRMHERADGNPKRSNHFENECLSWKAKVTPTLWSSHRHLSKRKKKKKKERVRTHTNPWTQMFMASLFVIAKKQPNFPSTDLLLLFNH